MTRRPAVGLMSADPAFGRRSAHYLDVLGYDVRPVVADLAKAVAQGFDLLVVDLDPETDGFELIRRFRDAASASIMVLSPRHDAADSAVLLEIGIDDTMAKPVDLQELAARIRGILDRRGVGRRDLVRFETATADLAASCLLRHGCLPERLAPGEVALLRAFARNPHRVLTRDDLLDGAAAERFDVNDRAIDSRVARLRRKLGTDAIATVRGHGYMFVPPFEGTPSFSMEKGLVPVEHHRT